MKYLRCSSVLSLYVIVALRVPVLVKPEPRLDEMRVHFVGSARRSSAWRIGCGIGDMLLWSQ